MRTFAFQPLQNESTPNYIGVGPSVMLGYSFMQVFDLGGFGFYTPGGTKAFHPGKENAYYAGYGAQLGVRISESVYVAFLGGSSLYQSVLKASENELDGRWEGPVGGIVLGSIHRVDKKNYWQVSFEMMHGLLSSKDTEENIASQQEGEDHRSIDQVGVSVTYTFNGFMSGFRRRGFFNLF
ncbi:MAG: hypothetical protein AB8C84_06635 [Oligoflexales bacterium]